MIDWELLGRSIVRYIASFRSLHEQQRADGQNRVTAFAMSRLADPVPDDPPTSTEGPATPDKVEGPTEIQGELEELREALDTVIRTTVRARAHHICIDHPLWDDIRSRARVARDVLHDLMVYIDVAAEVRRRNP